MTKRASKVRADVGDDLARHALAPTKVADTKLVAIDPGDRWTGVAFFTTDDEGGWYCQDAQEFDPPDFEDALAELLLLDRSVPPPIIVFEKWRLYGDKASQQTGSEFLATQHIGVIEYIVRVHNEHAKRHQEAEVLGKIMTCELQGGQCADPLQVIEEITIAKQGAEIKKPTAGILRTKKIKSVAKPISKAEYGGRDHIVEAELHGWYYIFNVLKAGPSK